MATEEAEESADNVCIFKSFRRFQIPYMRGMNDIQISSISITGEYGNMRSRHDNSSLLEGREAARGGKVVQGVVGLGAIENLFQYCALNFPHYYKHSDVKI